MSQTANGDPTAEVVVETQKNETNLQTTNGAQGGTQQITVINEPEPESLDSKEGGLGFRVRCLPEKLARTQKAVLETINKLMVNLKLESLINFCNETVRDELHVLGLKQQFLTIPYYQPVMGAKLAFETLKKLPNFSLGNTFKEKDGVNSDWFDSVELPLRKENFFIIPFDLDNPKDCIVENVTLGEAVFIALMLIKVSEEVEIGDKQLFKIPVVIALHITGNTYRDRMPILQVNMEKQTIVFQLV